MADPAAGRGGIGAARPIGRNEVWLRVASALVLAPLALVTAYAGGWPFVAFWGLAATGVMWEWAGLVAGDARHRVAVAGGGAVAAAAVLLVVGLWGAAVAVLTLGALAAAGLAPPGGRVWSGAGGLYAGAMLAAPVALRNDAADWGFVALIFLFAVVWTTDIVAFFVGRAVGGPKLWRAVSPKKTWSGALGGTAAAVVAALIVATAAGIGNLAAVALVSLVLSAVAAAGDLLESALKRRFGAKDAGQLIPGHGGLMDRLDGFLTAAVAAALLGLARGGIDAPARGLLIW